MVWGGNRCKTWFDFPWESLVGTLGSPQRHVLNRFTTPPFTIRMYHTFASSMNNRQHPNGFYLVVLFILIKTFCHLFLSHDPNLRIFHNLFIAIRQEKPFCTKVVGSFLTPHLRNFFCQSELSEGNFLRTFSLHFSLVFDLLWLLEGQPEGQIRG